MAMNFFEFDEDEVRKALNVLKPNGQLFELRYIAKGKKNYSGYFKDVDTCINALNRFRPVDEGNMYISLNYINDACFSRSQQNVLVQSSETTSDRDVVGYDWLFIDLDPVRASGVSSSDKELECARQKAHQINSYLTKQRDFHKPIVAMSGNGYHLLYKIHLANDEMQREIINNILRFLNAYFSDDKIDIDVKVFNPARICKLYGTYATKGANTEERPHRLSKIVYVPDEIEAVDIEYLRKLADEAPKSETPNYSNNYNPRSFDLETWIVEHNIRTTDTITKPDGTKKFILECCPFNDSHKGKDAVLYQSHDGKIGFNCFHASCADKKWQDVRQLYEPNAYNKNEYHMPNYRVDLKYYQKADGSFSTLTNVIDDGEEEKQPAFYSIKELYNLQTPPEEFIKTGIKGIDDRLGGLKKTEVTLMSGLRASGKTSILSQFALYSASQDYRTAIYSGEMTPKKLLDWMMLQAAGHSNTEKIDKQSEFSNAYKVKDDATKEKIVDWLDDKVYIYNTLHQGNNFNVLINAIKSWIAEHKLDLLILDNLMTIDVSDNGFNENQQQSNFVKQLVDLAKFHNMHILFVAHPRKSTTLLRLQDVAGSNNLVNAVDTALIVHRVNNDFKKYSKEEYGWKENTGGTADEIFKSTNCIEIAKDRNQGFQDIWIPLFYEPSTKMLRNGAGDDTNVFQASWKYMPTELEVFIDDE